MRKIAIICIILIFSTAVVPCFIEAENKFHPSDLIKSGTADQATTENIQKKNYIITLAAEYCDDSLCDETLKAILIISKNNVKALGSESEPKVETLENTLISRLTELYNISEAEILYNGKNVYLPLADLSCGNTSENKKYPYLVPVASPWDCFSTDYVYDKEYTAGISIYGIDYLCKKGYTCKEALSWYLPEFDIK